MFEAYIVQYKFDVICISEKYLDPDVISDITQSNNPTNTRKGAHCSVGIIPQFKGMPFVRSSY